MSESERKDEPERLEMLALLYAGGALKGTEAEGFEQRLAEDQQAREALCRAAELLHGGAADEMRPDPAYRDRVRRRLQPRSSLLNWLLRRRLYSGHPAVWTGVGAAAAVLIMVLFPWHGMPPAPAGVHKVQVQQPRALPRSPRSERAAEEARIWTQMPRSEHLLKAHNEEARRKERAAKLQRLMRMAEARARPFKAMPMKN